MTKSRKPGAITIARRIVQIVMLALFAVPLIAAGWGLAGMYQGGEEPLAAPTGFPWWGSLSSSHIVALDLLDPFAAMQVMAAAKTIAFSGLVGVLPVLLAYGIVRGRAFCGWVCPVNLVLEAVDWIRAKAGIRVREMAFPRWVKVVVAGAMLVLSAALSLPVFESLSPVGALTKAILFGSFTGVWTLVAIVVAEVLWCRRVWCRSVCPLGGMYEAIGAIGLVSVCINHDACTKCGLCQRVCLSDPAILEAPIDGSAARVASGDCMLCGKCVEACPTHALRIRPCLPRNPEL